MAILLNLVKSTAICVPNQVSHKGTSLRQVQGNAILWFFLEDGTCIRDKHMFLSSNDTNSTYPKQILYGGISLNS